MVENAPEWSEIENDLSIFLGDYNLVAHNASFDKRFLDAELGELNYAGEFACSMLISRRLN